MKFIIIFFLIIILKVAHSIIKVVFGAMFLNQLKNKIVHLKILIQLVK